MLLGEALSETARRTPQTTALAWADIRVTYEALDRHTTALARTLLSQQLKPGDRVAVHWENAVETVSLYFACFKAGLIVVPINIRLQPAEIALILASSEPSVCFSPPELSELITPAVKLAGTGVAVHNKVPEGSTTLTVDLPRIRESDECIILYTSGTTARPKGATHTHASLISSAQLILSLIGDAGAVALTLTQISHISAIVGILLPSILDGKTLVLLPRYHPVMALDSIEKFGVSYTVGMPFMINALIEEHIRQPRILRTLKTLGCGGDTVPMSLQQRSLDIFGIPLLEILAMTESCPVVWNTADDLRPGSLGKPRNGVQVKVVHADGTPCEPGMSGELCVRSPGNFAGYWKDAEATAAALQDGWLHTGDLVREDAEGYCFFAGRLKQIIVREGANIAPQEVEEALCSHPAVLEAGVVGAPDGIYGQKVIAFAALRPGQSITEGELRTHSSRLLAAYRVPERVFLLAQLPKGITGKVDRRALADSVEKALANAAD